MDMFLQLAQTRDVYHTIEKRKQKFEDKSKAFAGPDVSLFNAQTRDVYLIKGGGKEKREV